MQRGTSSSSSSSTLTVVAMTMMMVMTIGVREAEAVDFRTVMDYINDTPELSTLKGLLEKANIDSALAAPGAISTLFAPSNAAFAKLPSYIFQALQTDSALLQRALMGHVMDSAFISLFISNDHSQNTLSGVPIRFNIYNRTVAASGCAIVDSDIILRNGIIHIIDEVILPAEGDILKQILSDDAEFEDMIAALAVTNLLGDLEFEAITVFAPLNSAFQSYFQNNLPDNMDIVKDLLLNHIVNGTYYPVGLKDGDTLTSLSGHLLTVSKTGSGALQINGHRTDGIIYATNGIIHVMTSVLDSSGI